MAWVWMWIAAVSGAQEPSPAAAERLLVATFQPLDTASEAEATRITSALALRLQGHATVVPMREVPPFPPLDTDGETYLLACPPDNYSGCALVVGQRADVRWVVGATVRYAPDEFDPSTGHSVLDVTFVDVAGAREAARFALPMLGDEGVALDGVARVYADMVAGALDLTDQRDLSPDETPEEIARREAAARSVGELEQRLGTAVRSEDVRRIDPPKLTRADLADLSDGEGMPPWERAGLTEREYPRFANSGRTADEWRSERQGRLGEISVRGAVAGGGGPWSQNHEAKLLRGSADLQPIHTAQFLEVVRGGSGAFEAELGFGVAPWVEVSLVAGMHTGRATILRDEDVEDQAAIPGTATTSAISTYHYGVRARVLPFVHASARPTMAIGAVWWTGSGLPQSDSFPRLDAPTQLLLQLLPGAEASPSRHVTLFAHTGPQPRIGGTRERSTNVGSGLDAVPQPIGASGIGWTLDAGVQLRVGPLFRTQLGAH